MANEKLIVELTAQIQGLKSGLDSASAQLTKFNDKTTNTGKNAEKDFDAIGSAASKVGGIVAGAFAIGSVVSFGQGIIAATSEFQKFEAVLSNTLGSSSAAQLALSQIQQFAATTPFQINELTGAFVKLANQGFKPNITQMRLLGDLASSTGKSFDQLAEAILDAQTGEFERLKEFGVRAAVAGDQVTFTFKGIKTQVDNTSEAIRGYVLSLGAAEGVSGSMEKISGTLGGRISNVKDKFRP
jgi:phage tail tape-measure protein